jgi:hypothetical protein
MRSINTTVINYLVRLDLAPIPFSLAQLCYMSIYIGGQADADVPAEQAPAPAPAQAPAAKGYEILREASAPTGGTY